MTNETKKYTHCIQKMKLISYNYKKNIKKNFFENWNFPFFEGLAIIGGENIM